MMVPFGLFFTLTLCAVTINSAESWAASSPSYNPPAPIPITVLSGFLGSGKTTLLQHLLTNNEGLKIAVIVNDVAEVNIDNKLIVGRTAVAEKEPSATDDNDNDDDSTERSTKSVRPAGIVQLSNGCACCSLSDELLTSVSELITLSDLQAISEDENGELQRPFDHIVIELSGVASPAAIRANFQDAADYGMPLIERVRLDTMITVIDCSSYLSFLKDAKIGSRQVTEQDAPDLFFRNEEEKNTAKLLQGGIFDLIGSSNQDSAFETEDHDDSASVSQLLVEQTEIADILLLNKIDILNDDKGNTKEEGVTLENIETIVTAFNPRAKIMKTKFGVVERLGDVLAAAMGEGVVEAGVVDDHRDSIQAAMEREKEDMRISQHESSSHEHDHSETPSSGHGHERSHDHSPSPSHEHKDDHLKEVEVSSSSHEHSHGHSESKPSSREHSHDHSTEISSLTSHEHSHDHDVVCTDPSHDHEHTHEHSHNHVVCNDPNHDHSHDHNHETNVHGIGSYVYRARRPFHPKRLVSFLGMMPIVRGIPSTLQDNSDDDNDEIISITSEKQKKTLQNIIRSKGFIWLADSHIAAMYWSHAGSSFELQCLGRWWATLDREQWPEEAVDTILADFDDNNHIEETLDTSEDGMLETVGDRRQEVVLIGPGMSDMERKEIVRAALDDCLLTDKEFALYKKTLWDKNQKERSLKAVFENPLSSVCKS